MARIKNQNGWAFYCHACRSLHRLDLRFRFNYDMNLPTFKDQIHLTVTLPPGHPQAGEVVECHSTITKGIIKYLETSTHALKGQSLGLIDFEEMAAMRRAQEEAKKSMAARVD